MLSWVMRWGLYCSQIMLFRLKKCRNNESKVGDQDVPRCNQEYHGGVHRHATCS